MPAEYSGLTTDRSANSHRMHVSVKPEARDDSAAWPWSPNFVEWLGRRERHSRRPHRSDTGFHENFNVTTFHSTALMTWSDQRLQKEIQDNKQAIEALACLMSLGRDFRHGDDTRQLEWLQSQELRLRRELERRQRKAISTPARPDPRPSSVSTGRNQRSPAHASPAASTVEDFPGPPIIVRTPDGHVRAWRPGDSHIHKTRK
jgi:hypothetical protein